MPTVFNDKLYFITGEYLTSCNVSVYNKNYHYYITCYNFSFLPDSILPLSIVQKIASSIQSMFQCSLKSITFNIAPVLFGVKNAFVKCKVVEFGSKAFLVM